VQLVEYPSASEVLRAFRNQAIDGMVISLDELFGLAADGLQPKIIAVIDVSHGADAVVGRSGMRTMKDLKGKSVAVEERRAGRVRAEPARLPSPACRPATSTSCTWNRTSSRARSNRGRSTARSPSIRFARQLLKAGGVTLFDSTKIPGEIVDLLAIRASVIDRQPKKIDALLTGWFARLDYMKRDPAGRRAAHGDPPADHRRTVSSTACAGCTFRRAKRTWRCSAGSRRSWRSPGGG
jgi:NitT/TauT family transport system substrate-binding protein